MKPLALLLILSSAGLLPSCRGHLYFFTNTSLGVDVSTDAATSLPKVVLGYKRQEGAVFPVIDGDANLLTTDGFSVLAKYNGGGGGGDAKLEAAQFFATGAAAINLSKTAPGILANNPEIAKAVATLGPSLLAGETLPDGVKIRFITSVIDALAQLPDPTSQGHVAILSKMGTPEFDKTDFIHFGKDPMNATRLVIEHPTGTPIRAGGGPQGYDVIKTYFTKLDASIRTLKQVDNTWTFNAGAVATPQDAKTALAKQEALRANAKTAAYESPQLVAAIRHFAALLLNPKKK